MRVAAGVILIIVAVFNLVASLGYVVGGGAATGLSRVGDDVAQEFVTTQNANMTEEERKELAEGFDTLSDSGGLLMAFGVFLLVSVGILIAGAVFLFQGKKPTFIMAAGGMAILAEIIGILITSFGVINLVGLVGGALAVVAANSIRSSESPVAAA